MKTCTKCGNLIEETEELCPDCRQAQASATTAPPSPAASPAKMPPTVSRAVPSPAPASPVASRNCPHCGAYLQYPDGRFCPACHTSLSSAPSPSSPSRPIEVASDIQSLSYQSLPGALLHKEAPVLSGRNRVPLVIGAVVALFLVAFLLQHVIGRLPGFPSHSLPRIGKLASYPFDQVTILDDRTEPDEHGNLRVAGTLRNNCKTAINISLDYDLFDAALNTLDRGTVRFYCIQPYAEFHFTVAFRKKIEVKKAAGYEYAGAMCWQNGPPQSLNNYSACFPQRSQTHLL